MTKKKLTMKTVEKRLDFLLKQILETQKSVDYIHKVIVFYIQYSGDLTKFQKYLEEKDNESRKSDSKKSIEGNEGIDTGKQSSKKGNSKSKVTAK